MDVTNYIHLVYVWKWCIPQDTDLKTMELFEGTLFSDKPICDSWWVCWWQSHHKWDKIRTLISSTTWMSSSHWIFTPKPKCFPVWWGSRPRDSHAMAPFTGWGTFRIFQVLSGSVTCFFLLFQIPFPMSKNTAKSHFFHFRILLWWFRIPTRIFSVLLWRIAPTGTRLPLLKSCYRLGWSSPEISVYPPEIKHGNL